MGYDDVKQAGGRRYTGMKVGRRHHWDYPDGAWVERKTSPDTWEVRFTSHKRRKGRGAPAGSGARLGAEYHWFIVAHQRARKVGANTYVTDLVGAKHMVAFRQPGWQRWSSQFKGHKSQRQRLERLLEAALKAVRAAGEPEGNGLVALPGMEGRVPSWPPELPPLDGPAAASPPLRSRRHAARAAESRRPMRRPKRALGGGRRHESEPVDEERHPA